MSMAQNGSPMSRAAVLVLLLAASSLATAPLAAEQETRHDTRSFRPFSHSLGLELGFVLIPFGFGDPYSAPVGASLFYEMRPLSGTFPLFIGAIASYFDFNPVNEHFGDSFMIQLGLYLGYDFVFPFTEQTGLVLSPYGGYKHYFREHRFWDEIIHTNRPIFLVGSKLSLYVSRRFSFGLGLEYNLIVDQNPINTLVQTNRITLGF